MAEQIIKHPLHPMDFQVCWNLAEGCTKAYVLTPGNALMGYALVPTILAGGSEWMAHVTQIIFGLVAIMAMASLVLRFGWSRVHARIGALLLVAIPPFLPMSSTAFPDVLATATGLVAVERLLAWKSDRKWTQGLAAAIALGLAGFARAHLALLIPLGGFLLLDSAKPRQVWSEIRKQATLWVPVFAGALLLFAAILLTRERSMAIDPPPAFRGVTHIPRNLVSYLLYLAFPLPLAFYWVLYRWNTRKSFLLLTLIMAGVSAAIGVNFRLVIFLAVMGLGALVDLLIQAFQTLDHRQLFLLFWLLVPLPIVYYGHLPVKYLLPCLPAVILICFQLGTHIPAPMARTASIVLIVCGGIYSLLILHSDAEFANFGRSAMYRLVKPEVADGRNVWYDGDFSSYWYARHAGGTLFVNGRSHPNPGDRLVVGLYEENSRLQVLKKYFPRRTRLKAISHEYSFGRTMGCGMGLYTNLIGFWPWGFGRCDWNRYELWQLDAPGPNSKAETP